MEKPARSFRFRLIPRFLESVLRVFWQVSISLKFAVVVMVLLTGALIAATILESMYDTPSAQYWVYTSGWFFTLLGMLFWLIFAVALSRLPWKKRHLPFLCAHAGIMILLYGSWLTFQFGLDGSLQVSEGRTESAVELNEPVLLVASADPNEAPFSRPIPWMPPNADFEPIELPRFGIRVARYLSHADSQVNFVPSTDPRDLSGPAIKIKLAGGPTAPPFMRAGTEAWLWGGDRNWSRAQLGAATLSIAGSDIEDRPASSLFSGAGVEMAFRRVPVGKGEKTQGSLEVAIQTAEGKRTVRAFPYSEPKDLIGKVIETGWKFDARVTILEWIPRAMSDVAYAPSRIQYGTGASPSAILLEGSLPAEGAPGAKPPRLWLGLGERAIFETGGRKLTLGYFPRRVILPFGIALRRFEIDRYRGTSNPMEFSSIVDVKTGAVENGAPAGPAPENHRISMNEPMKYGGYTFYQSSYVDAEPRPTTSIFSVNQDPGRWMKYLGSFLIVLGSIWLFAVKYVTKKREPAAPTAAAKG